MTRDEFLSRLGELLACLPAEQVEENQGVLRGGHRRPYGGRHDRGRGGGRHGHAR